MKKTLAEYETDGCLRGDDGCFHDSHEGLLQAGILGFCCCGAPEESLLYVLRGLELIDEKSPGLDGDFDAWWGGHKARLDTHFKTEGAMYFFWYWADKEGFSEHGGSVPGGLTKKGENFLSLLREWRDSLA